MNKFTSTMLQIFTILSLGILAISPVTALAVGTIVDVASANASTSTLVAAVSAAGLVPTLSSTGPFTVFAPTNDAFNALDTTLGKPTGSTVALLVRPENKTLLADILKYHVVSGSVNAATAATLTSATSVEGSTISISTSGGNIFLNAATQNAKVVTADVLASNGIIHLIDKVILTPALVTRVIAAYSALATGSVNLPSSSAKFGADITACRATFDWVTYIADQRAGRTNSNPYIDQGCVTQFSAVVDENSNNILDTGDIKTNQYSQFSVGAASVKAAFGTDPVLGIFPTTVGTTTFPAQAINTFTNAGAVAASKAPTNRAVRSGVNSVFTTGQLSELFSTSGGSASTSNIPRIFSTGPDTYNYFQNKSNSTQQIVPLSSCLTNGAYDFNLCSRVTQDLATCSTNGTFDFSKCSREYQGGWCSISGGNISVRQTRAGVAFNPSNYGKDPANPSVACARAGKANVEEQNLSVYQFIYEFKYPTPAQCADYFGVDAATCNTFYQKTYGQDLAGNTDTTTGSRILSVYTFYGSIDDLYSKFVGWVNPDVNGPRATSTDGFIKTYDGFSVYEL